MEKIILLSEGKYGTPIIKPMKAADIEEIHRIEWFTFKDAKSHYTRGKDLSKCGIHFYLDDKWFNAVWSAPYKYLDFFRQFAVVHTPDFSMYTDWPLSVQIYNNYRKMWLGAWWQANGINVVPTCCWSTPESFEFCFDGMPKHSVVSVSSVGCNANPETWEAFKVGCREMISRLEPETILWRGKVPEEFDFNIVRINDQGDLHFKERHTNSKKGD